MWNECRRSLYLIRSDYDIDFHSYRSHEGPNAYRRLSKPMLSWSETTIEPISNRSLYTIYYNDGNGVKSTAATKVSLQFMYENLLGTDYTNVGEILFNPELIKRLVRNNALGEDDTGENDTIDVPPDIGRINKRQYKIVRTHEIKIVQLNIQNGSFRDAGYRIPEGTIIGAIENIDFSEAWLTIDMEKLISQNTLFGFFVKRMMPDSIRELSGDWCVGYAEQVVAIAKPKKKGSGFAFKLNRQFLEDYNSMIYKWSYQPVKGDR